MHDMIHQPDVKSYRRSIEYGNIPHPHALKCPQPKGAVAPAITPETRTRLPCQRDSASLFGWMLPLPNASQILEEQIDWE